MKTKMFGLMAMILAAGVLVFSGCNKDKDDPPSMVEITVAADNTTISVVFSEAVYANNDKTGNLDGNSIEMVLTGASGDLTGSFTVQHLAGTAQLTINLTLNGVPTGAETVTIKPKANGIFNGAGVAMDVAEFLTANLKETGVIGKWYSSGADVAVLLRAAGIDSIYAEFRANDTYVVRSYTTDLSTTILEGTYVQALSGTGNIWNITVNQSTPNSLTSVGIFEVFAGSPYNMKYEVAQTDPNIPGVTPPTATGGFGSTSAGAYQDWNVQTYRRLD